MALPPPFSPALAATLVRYPAPRDVPAAAVRADRPRPTSSRRRAPNLGSRPTRARLLARYRTLGAFATRHAVLHERRRQRRWATLRERLGEVRDAAVAVDAVAVPLMAHLDCCLQATGYAGVLVAAEVLHVAPVALDRWLVNWTRPQA
jgi:hypothetical protein